MIDQLPGIVTAVGVIAILVVLVFALATTKRGGSPSGTSGWLRKLQREPAAIGGLIGTFVALGAAFGLQLSGEQVGAITAAVVFIIGFVVRFFVTPIADPDPAIVAKVRQ